MARRVSQHVSLAPGGLIPDIPENQELLERIRAAPKLSPEQLLDLAIFYQVYPTNAFLADHLALVAETNAICEFGGNDPYWDPIEDHLCGYDATAEDNQEAAAFLVRLAETFVVYTGNAYKGERHSRIAVARARYEIKCISFGIPGLGLLIETRHGRNPHVIGVCPELKHSS